MRRFTIILIAATLLSALSWHAASAGGLVFDDSAPDQIRIANDYYELRLSKTNGSFLSIGDVRAGATLGLGSNGGCLWGVVSTDPKDSYRGGCSFAANYTNSFTYAWDGGRGLLTMTYTWGAQQQAGINATATLHVSTGTAFDLQLTVQNRWGKTIQNAILPSDLLFPIAQTAAAYAPYQLPGVRLSTDYLRRTIDVVPTYPGGEVFADYLALDVAGGHFAFYSVNPPPNPIAPVAVGFVHAANNGSYCPDPNYCTYHSFHTWLADGGAWTSPVVRMQVGQSVDQTVLAYRNDNGYNAMRSVADKLGSRFSAYAQAPLIKVDAVTLGVNFRRWIPQYAQLPVPSILHPSAYMPGGHDHNYPDLIPPDSRWGTTADFNAALQAARQRGIIVVPYTQPTWWDPKSPTLHSLTPAQLRDAVAIDNDGNPITETYGPNTGYRTSPASPFVQQRLDRQLNQWRDAVPVDCIFEDSIGARADGADFNRNEPTPRSYSTEWLAHTLTYANRCLMTEDGWDRLAESEVAFHGGLLLSNRLLNYADNTWGAGNWEPFPLADWLLHDKVLLFQHDLGTEVMLPVNPRRPQWEEKETLTWNMLFGLSLSYEWRNWGGGSLGLPELDLVTALQRAVAARYSGQIYGGYSRPQANVGISRFADLTIVGNLQHEGSYDYDGYRVAPLGFLALTDDGSVQAGIFAGVFAGQPLSDGDHYLIVEQGTSQTIVRQPLGSDTALTVPLPSSLSGGVRVLALDAGGRTLGEAQDAQVSGGTVRFTYHGSLGGGRVERYAVQSGASSCGSSTAPQLVQPRPHTTLAGSSVTFCWTQAPRVQTYWLYAGSSRGGYDLYSSGPLDAHTTSLPVSNLPTDGRPIYVRLWWYTTSWHYADYSYTAATAARASPPD